MNKKTKLILTTLLIYGIPILLWSFMPYTRNIWGSFTDSFIFNFLFYNKTIFWPMGIIFDVLFLYCFFTLLYKKESSIDLEKERVFYIFSGVKKLINWIFINKIQKEAFLIKEEKISLLFYLVKIYFTPVMLKFLVENVASLIRVFPETVLPNITINSLLGFYFPFAFYSMLVIDTLIFTSGYLFESRSLKNVVKSVEPTALGWFVAIICYPPVNNLTGNFLGWYSSDFGNFKNVNINLIAGFLSLILFFIYVWASVALGFKASNLTNRGIVSNGPYKYVRHPAYISKNLSWWIMAIPAIQYYGWIAIFSLASWSFIYFLRALTEEKHLMQDQEYIDYIKKVKYMFIPGII
jgi:protein-S-isoprenylcysteine O-methyltransferase Ste14